MILPTTAERNGGLCMPCKSGYRKNIEASKKRHEEQKKYDPQRELWKSLVTRVHKTDAGFKGLSPDEKLYFAVGVLEGEVYNGGFDQFFWNSSGGYLRDAVSGLEILGAYQALDLLLKAKQVAFSVEPPPEDWEKRRILLRSREDKARDAALDALDKAYWKDPDKLSERLTRFAAERGLITPFLK